MDLQQSYFIDLLVVDKTFVELLMLDLVSLHFFVGRMDF
jgi:hypothetical protein